MTKPLLQPDKLHLVDFRVTKEQIDSPFNFDIDKVVSHSTLVNFDLGFNLEDKIVKADFSIEISTLSQDKNLEEASGIFHFTFIFLVENIEELVIPATLKKKIEVDGGLGNALASITYSTSRGILMNRLNGTALENFILPIINPNDLLK